MRRGLIIATGLFIMCATSAGATPLPDTALNEIYGGCVRSLEQNAPTVPAEVRTAYCGCVRGEFQRTHTLESVIALEERIRTSSQTMQDVDARETMERTCVARVQEAGPASTPASRPATPVRPTTEATRPAPAAPFGHPGTKLPPR